MIRRASYAVSLFLACSVMVAQLPATDTLSGDVSTVAPANKLSYNVTLGSQFTSISGYGSGLTSYITPRVSYNISPKLRIGGGLSIMQTHYFNARSWSPREQSGTHDGRFTDAILFVDGNYQVTDRLSIFGSAFKQVPLVKDPLPYNPFNPVSSNGAQGVDFNVGYRIGKNTYIQAGFRYSDGVNPYGYDPFGGSSWMNGSFSPVPAFGVPRW